MAAKLLSTIMATSGQKCFDDDDITSEEFTKSLKDAEQDFHQIIEEEKIHLLVEVDEKTDNIPSMIKHTFENMDIEPYVKDIPLDLQAIDRTSSEFSDIEYDADKKHQKELTHSYCTYCTKYKRILSVEDVNRGDSIRFQKYRGLYYHHAIVKKVVQIDPTSFELTLIHLQKCGIPIMTKVIEDRKQYNFNQTIIEKVFYKSNPFSPDQIVQRAEEYMKVNSKAKFYNIAGNNCEHISSEIAQDVSVSPQVISKLDHVTSGISWIFQVFCKFFSKLVRIPGFATIGNLHSMIDIRNKILQLKHFLVAEIVCFRCFDKEHKRLKIALALSLIGLVVSVLSHFNWVTLSISMIVSIAFPFIAPKVAKHIMPLVQPAFLVPKYKMSAENKPKAGDVVTFDYHSLSVEGVVTMVCEDTTDAKVIKATIVHFPWPGILRRYTVTEEDIYLKLSDEVFVIDHKGKVAYSPTQVVDRAKKEVGKTNHNSLTYRSSHLSRYCKVNINFMNLLSTYWKPI